MKQLIRPKTMQHNLSSGEEKKGKFECDNKLQFTKYIKILLVKGR